MANTRIRTPTLFGMTRNPRRGKTTQGTVTATVVFGWSKRERIQILAGELNSIAVSNFVFKTNSPHCFYITQLTPTESMFNSKASA